MGNIKQILDFFKLPDSLSEAKIEGKIMLMDNFGEPMREDRKQAIQNFTYPTHNELLIAIFCLKGSASFRLNLKEETVTANQLFFILPQCIFEIRGVSNDFEGAVMLAMPDELMLSEDTMVDMSIRRYLNTQHTLTVKPENIDDFTNLYLMLKRALCDYDNPFRNTVVKKYCQIIVFQAWNVFLRSQMSVITTQSRKQEIFDMFIRAVEKNFIKERRIQFYADYLHLSAKYLSSVIKEVSNKFASDWVDEYVLLEAKALLKQPNITILQISDRLNFPNQSFFGRYFKHHTGYSPKEYRKL